MTVRDTLSIFFRHLGPERRWIVVHLPCVLANGAMASVPPFLAGVFVNQLIRHPRQASFTAGEAVVTVLVVGAICTLLHFTRNYLSTLISERVGCRFQCALYEHLQRLSADFYQVNRVGEVTARLTHDVNNGIRPLYPQAVELLNGAAMLVAACTCLALVSVPLFWVFAVLTFLSLAVGQWAIPIIIRNFEELQNVNGRLNAQITEAVSVHSLVRAFAREEEARRRMQPLIDARAAQQLKALAFLWRFMVFVWSFDIVSGPFLLLLLGALLYGRGITAGSLVSALLYWRMAGNFKFQVTEGITGVMSGLGSVRRAAAFFEETPLVADRPYAPALPPGPGSIEFENVTFRYPHQRDEFVLGPISLSIPAGTRCALLGPSGGGKTTLVQLLGRIYDPAAGVIRIDGHDIRSVTQLSLRQRIGFMSQETQLFDGTLRDNLLFAAPQADEATMQEAMARAGLETFLAVLPESLETVVGERGIRLSGGQRQRLALARLLLLDPEIIVLDEPTSALDAATEAEIWASIEELLRGRTQIVITHRISTALRAEWLAVIHHGRLDASGTADDLRRKSELFRDLCATQHAEGAGR
jgi:ATP-binding cassette subfamily B protein